MGGDSNQMKLKLAAFFSTLLLATPIKALATPEYWEGFIGIDTEAPNLCVLDYTNLRTTPEFNNNVRAVIIPGSCGEGLQLSEDEEFALVEFYFENLGFRRYWVDLRELYFVGF